MKKNTRERILDAAIKLFNQKGYGHVSLQDLAKELGMSRGNLSYHFPDKADLLPGIVDKFASRLKDYRLSKEPLPTFSNLRIDLRFYFELQRDYKCILLDPYVLEHPAVSETVKAFSKEAIRDFDAAIAFALEIGTMKKEPYPGVYENLSINTWMLMFLWYPREMVLGKRTFEEKEKATWCMLIPYFTEKGREALKNVLGEGYLNELGTDFRQKQTGTRII
ncbi:MAG: TetR/AcrR family transcriptional regulator [Bacteroidota bacterium]